MHVTQQDLVDAGCWFDSDRAGGAEMTAFKREARWHQHQWARTECSVEEFGSHRGRRKHPDEVPAEICNGTKLTKADADRGLNFLSDEVCVVVKGRVEAAAEHQHQTLDATRLSRDLLSSMPMAFNLFAEASLQPNEESRRALAALFGVDVRTPSDIVFEWSPGRRDPAYTDDRTAFDVALLLGSGAGAQTVVGIETKYHEHSARESRPSGTKPHALERYNRQTQHLKAIAEHADVFADGWESAVLDTDLRQLWRDHLLALSMRAHQSWSDQTRYVLLYPSRNVSFRDAANRYGALLRPGDLSFQAVTIDDVLDAAFAHGGPTKDRFRARYLWWVGND